MFQYEHRRDALLPMGQFLRRMLAHGGLALTLLAVSLLLGVLGYRSLGHLAWIDALLNASMILGGMGPVDTLHTRAAKVFASCYALFAGVAFLAIASVLLAPLIHRLLHRLHLEQAGDSDSSSG